MREWENCLPGLCCSSALTRDAFSKLSDVWKERVINKHIELRLLKIQVFPVFLNGGQFK